MKELFGAKQVLLPVRWCSHVVMDPPPPRESAFACVLPLFWLHGQKQVLVFTL